MLAASALVFLLNGITQKKLVKKYSNAIVSDQTFQNKINHARSHWKRNLANDTILALPSAILLLLSGARKQEKNTVAESASNESPSDQNN